MTRGREVEETEETVLRPHAFTCRHKLDGSLCSPLRLNGVVRWATKAYVCDAIEQFATAGHNELARKCLEMGCTPLFECHTQTRERAIRKV